MLYICVADWGFEWAYVIAFVGESYVCKFNCSLLWLHSAFELICSWCSDCAFGAIDINSVFRNNVAKPTSFYCNGLTSDWSYIWNDWSDCRKNKVVKWLMKEVWMIGQFWRFLSVTLSESLGNWVKTCLLITWLDTCDCDWLRNARRRRLDDTEQTANIFSNSNIFDVTKSASVSEICGHWLAVYLTLFPA